MGYGSQTSPKSSRTNSIKFYKWIIINSPLWLDALPSRPTLCPRWQFFPDSLGLVVAVALPLALSSVAPPLKSFFFHFIPLLFFSVQDGSVSLGITFSKLFLAFHAIYKRPSWQTRESSTCLSCTTASLFLDFAERVD